MTEETLDTILSPGENSFKEEVKLEVDKIKGVLIDSLISTKKSSKEKEKVIEALKEIIDLFREYYISAKDIKATIKELNKILGKYICSENKGSSNTDICVKKDGEHLLLSESLIEDNLDNYFKKFRDKYGQKVPSLYSMLESIIKNTLYINKEKYKRYINALKALSGLLDSCGLVAAISYLYSKLVGNYSLFDNMEWFLVLLSSYARKIKENDCENKCYLPVCPTTRHAVIAYYELVECAKETNEINVKIHDMLEKLLQGPSSSGS